MNASDLLLTSPVSSPAALDKSAAAASAKSADAKKTEKVAKDFESVFLTRVLEEMKNTIGNGLGEEETGSEQIKGLFWLCLAQYMADKGGLGMWKDISRFFNDMQKPQKSAQTLDEKL